MDTQPIGEHALDEASQRASIRKQMPEAPAPGAPAPGAPAAAQGVGSANDAREVEQESAGEVSQRAREVEQENASEAFQRAREVERSQKPTTEGQGQQSNEKKENTEVSLSQSTVVLTQQPTLELGPPSNEKSDDSSDSDADLMRLFCVVRTRKTCIRMLLVGM